VLAESCLPAHVANKVVAENNQEYLEDQVAQHFNLQE
jgi:hypothetical protein